MRATWLSVVLCAAVASHTLACAEDSHIVVQDAGNTFELTVPQSRLILSMPKGGLTIVTNQRRIGGGTESARYFQLTDPAEGLIVSGWFEPARRYADLDESWRQAMEHTKKEGFPAPHDVEHSELGTWRAILYNYSLPNLSSAHVRTSYLAAGTWIDLHVSVTSARPGSETRKQVETFVRSMQVREKQ